MRCISEKLAHFKRAIHSERTGWGQDGFLSVRLELVMQMRMLVV